MRKLTSSQEKWLSDFADILFSHKHNWTFWQLFRKISQIFSKRGE